MRAEDNITKKIVGEVIREGQPGKVTIDNRGFIDAFSEGRREHKLDLVHLGGQWLRSRLKLNVPENQGLRFLLIVATLFMVLVATIWYGVFFINDVLLHETRFHINEQGTIIPNKPFGGEYAFFLFNTSEIWANPGIQVNKRDRIRLSISGGFNSSIEHVLDASVNNEAPKYAWVFPERMGKKSTGEPDWALKYCLSQGYQHRERSKLFKKHHFDFGTVMYTIQSESANIANHPLKVPQNELRAWAPGRRFQKAYSSGYLYFAVNDLVFDPDKPETIKGYYDEFRRRANKELQETQNPSKINSLIREIKESKEEEKIVSESDPFFLYKDNLGQLLVAVEIQRALPSFWRWPEGAFRAFENGYIWLKEGVDIMRSREVRCEILNTGKNLLCMILLALGALILFLAFGLANLGISLVWTTLLCVTICFIYQIIRRFYIWLFRVTAQNKRKSA